MSLQLWDDFEDEFTLFGISSNRLDEIKFIYAINQTFKVQFCRTDDLDITYNDQMFCYSLYHYSMEEEYDPFYIFKNLSHPNKGQEVHNSLFASLDSQRYILSKYKRFDYLLKIPYHLSSGDLNPLPLNDAWFISDFTIISDLSNKEKKLFFL